MAFSLTRKRVDFPFKLAGVAALVWGFLAAGALAQVTQPLVAIHDSELTRALEAMPASPPTPSGSGTTGFQWWPTDWHYFTMPEAIKETLRSDGTPFTVVGDSNITAGLLLTNGAPRFPIMISLASEAIRNDEIAQLTNYVAAGGFLFVGSSAFTRNTNGTTRGDFAFANELGLHMSVGGLNNWAQNNSFIKQGQHRLTAHFPSGTLTHRMPSSANEIPWGISPSHPFLAPHDIWQVQAFNGATVLATGDSAPYLVIKPYGKGYFIYCSAFQPLIGHGGFAPGMYVYMIFRKAIEWAFETVNQPVPRLSPWPYPYDAAFMIRHDLENYTNEIAGIEASAQVESNIGAKGDYYFCTGTLRVDAAPTYNVNSIVASLRRAVTNYGATIGPHNGGLKNPNNPSLVRGQYDYWHWGPDEALDVTPTGYPNGKSYATASISNSFRDIETWLAGIPTVRTWVACYFNSTRDDSYDLQATLGVKIAGDQKISPFPHWTFSTRTPGVRYPFVTEPVSDWFVNGLVAQSLEPWHSPGIHTSQTVHDAVDFYYNMGGLINIYSHTLSTGLGDAGSLVADYLTYSLNTNLHPRIWSANGVGIYQWWLQRSNGQVSASFATNSSQSMATITIKGATDTNTTVELLLPGTNAYCGFQVFTNGALAGANVYRIKGQLFKLRVGRTVTNALVMYAPIGGSAQSFSQNFDSVTAPALPSGWTTSASGVQSPWVTQTSVRDTTPNAAFVPGPANIGLSELVSPAIGLPAGTSQLTFRNNYDLETGAGTDGFDGGVLEIKIGANAFADIVTAGGSFSSGGYNSVIDTAYGNPIAGRAAWSGTSGGFVTTSVTLPASASGQNIQLRWRCGTDNGVAKTGWRIDTIAITSQTCLCCGGPSTNSPPILQAQQNRTIAALTTLFVTNTASDSDLPPQLLSYQLTAPAGATIDGNGIISWTPNSGQAPSTNLFTTTVTDNGTPPLGANNSFTVVVTAVANQAPVLPNQVNQTIAELTPLTVNNTATDPDGPANGLTYTLLVSPGSAAISATGIITWTPSEAQGPSTNAFTTRVTDSGVPQLSATNSFTIVVTEVNSSPGLPVQSARRITELTTLVVTNSASDADFPPNTLTYTLLAAPAGASISSAGVINWTPNESQGPSTNNFVTRVADNGNPQLNATNSFNVVVLETNSAPVLPAQTNRTVLELATLTVTNTATDTDIPANTLVYSLVAPPAGAGIDANGVITWTPSASQGPGTNVLTTIVTDDGVPAKSATNSFTVFVIDTNTPPVITAQPVSRTNSAGTTATFSVTANGSSLAYQWFKGAAALTSGTNATLMLSVSAADAGGYNVVVSNPFGSVTSVVATLTVIDPPVIVTQPVSRTNNAGTQATFSVSVTGTTPTFQWTKNGANLANGGNISGATAASLSISNVSSVDAAGYAVIVTNAAGGVTSVVATLTVIVPPGIVTQPASVTTNQAATATFTVVATGTSPSYQWFKSVTNRLVNGANIAGATSASLIVSNVASADAAAYTVVITNVLGSVTSAPATLTVTSTNVPPGQLFADDFARGTDPGPPAPWVSQSGTWTVTGGLLRAGINTLRTYGNLYITNSWSNYSAQCQIRFPAGAYGGGLGVRVNRQNGAHYAAWIYPENSPGGARLLKLIKFQTWTTWGYNGASFTPMQQVSLVSVGTNWHTLQMNCTNSQITVFYDGTQMISAIDTEATRYLTGGISVDLWTDATGYSMWVDSVAVNSLTSGNGPLFLAARPAPSLTTPTTINIVSLVRNEDQVILGWTSEPGKQYQLLFKNDLGDPTWQIDPTIFTATGSLASGTNVVGVTNQQRVYKVQLRQEEDL